MNMPDNAFDPQLAAILDFTPDDLALNRQGLLSTRQRQLAKQGVKGDFGGMFYVLLLGMLFFVAMFIIVLNGFTAPTNPSDYSRSTRSTDNRRIVSVILMVLTGVPAIFLGLHTISYWSNIRSGGAAAEQGSVYKLSGVVTRAGMKTYEFKLPVVQQQRQEPGYFTVYWIKIDTLLLDVHPDLYRAIVSGTAYTFYRIKNGASLRHAGIVSAEWHKPTRLPPRSSVPSAQDLTTIFQITPDDLAANRLGRLSERQRAALRRLPIERLKEHWRRWLQAWFILSSIGTGFLLLGGQQLRGSFPILPFSLLWGFGSTTVLFLFIGLLVFLQDRWLIRGDHVLVVSCSGVAAEATRHNRIVLDRLEFTVPENAASYFKPGVMYRVFYLSMRELGRGPRGGYRQTAPRILAVELGD